MDIRRRNQEMIDLYADGRMTQEELAAAYGLCRSRVQQIVRSKRKENVRELRIQEVYQSLDELDDEVVENIGLHSLACRVSSTVGVVKRWLLERGWEEGEPA